MVRCFRFTSARAARAAGFTLVEMLAVMVIITILFTFVVTRVLRGGEIVLVENTRQFLAQVGATISEFELDHGDYPRSTFPADMEPSPSKPNMGSEMLVISILSKDWTAREIADDRLSNTDADRTKQSLTSLTSADCFELADDWGNPIAYFHRRDFDKPQSYVTFDPVTGEAYEASVRARVNPKTGDPYNRQTYQLISAGSDGRFGPDEDGFSDDIGNFQ